MGAPFGVRGWVKLRSYTDPPERLLQHRRPAAALGGAWRPYRIEASGRSGGQLTVKLVGINDRDEAQALRGAPVGVPRSELPARGGEGFLSGRFDRLRGGEFGGRATRDGCSISSRYRRTP